MEILQSLTLRAWRECWIIHLRARITEEVFSRFYAQQWVYFSPSLAGVPLPHPNDKTAPRSPLCHLPKPDLSSYSPEAKRLFLREITRSRILSGSYARNDGGWDVRLRVHLDQVDYARVHAGGLLGIQGPCSLDVDVSNPQCDLDLSSANH